LKLDDTKEYKLKDTKPDPPRANDNRNRDTKDSSSSAWVEEYILGLAKIVGLGEKECDGVENRLKLGDGREEIWEEIVEIWEHGSREEIVGLEKLNAGKEARVEEYILGSETSEYGETEFREAIIWSMRLELVMRELGIEAIICGWGSKEEYILEADSKWLGNRGKWGKDVVVAESKEEYILGLAERIGLEIGLSVGNIGAGRKLGIMEERKQRGWQRAE
jgi:hypothetical protein